MKRLLLVTVLLAACLLPGRVAAADADPVRSGTILAGASAWSGISEGCEGAPDCRDWLASGCDPDLAGRDPAVMASIVDIADLADGVTRYRYEFSGWLSEGTMVQLWRGDCTEVGRWRISGNCSANQLDCRALVLVFRESTAWMTVTKTVYGGPHDWWLTPTSPASTAPNSSPSPEESPRPEPSPTNQPVMVERSVDLALRGHLRSVGSVVSEDASCRWGMPIVIQRKTRAGWIELRSTETDAEGRFTLRLKDRPGRYRAVAPETSSPERTCMSAVSKVVRHRH